MTRKLLVVDDDPAGCRLVRAIFAPEGFDVAFAHDGESGLAAATHDSVDLVLLDLRLPGLDGMTVLERLRDRAPSLPVVVLSGQTEVRTAVRATQLGAVDYLTKPIDPEELLLTVRRALETRALRVEVEELRQRVGDIGLATRMGSSPPVRQITDQVRVVAPSMFTVLILGETGTGKELVAQAIHQSSDRAKKPFIALDCGAIPDTLLESELFGHERGAFTGAAQKKQGQFHLAEGGTLFLDEVGNLPLGLQAKLLRVLESRQLQAVGATKSTPLDVRFIAATNDDLQERVTAGKFRADLYFRLAQYTIQLPALRERATDVPHLAQRFLEEASIELRRPVQNIAPDALALMQRYDWPGNVRELRNLIRRAVLSSRGATLMRSEVQTFLKAAKSQQAEEVAPATQRTLREAADEAARTAERSIIAETLRTTRGNKSQAARLLQTDYKTLHVKMKALGIRARDFSP